MSIAHALEFDDLRYILQVEMEIGRNHNDII